MEDDLPRGGTLPPKQHISNAPGGPSHGLVGRLLPFPSIDESIPHVPLLRLVSGPARIIETLTGAGPTAAPADIGTRIISEAASILDTEMARGVLAARAASPTALPGTADGNGALLRRAHEFVDALAVKWPALYGSPLAAATSGQRAGASRDAMPTLQPAVAVRAGNTATIGLKMTNTEGTPVHLRPGVTDLVGPNGRIAAAAVDLTPADVVLAAGQQQELRISIDVPAGTAAGRHWGLLILNGVQDSRALIMVDVT